MDSAISLSAVPTRPTLRSWSSLPEEPDALHVGISEQQLERQLRTPPVDAVREFYSPNSFAIESALSLSLAKLSDDIRLLASVYLYMNGEKATPAKLSPEYWGSRYLNEDFSAPDVFFAGVRKRALARSKFGVRLALAAAAWAWLKRQEEPDYVPADSIAADFRKMSAEQKNAWVDGFASAQSRSCAIEGVDIPASEISRQLESAVRN